MARADGPSRYLTALGLAFVLVSGLLLAVLEWIGQVTGATLLPRTLAAIQATDPNVVVLPPEIRHWGALKLARIAAVQPEVVMICSSRGNEFRREMFAPYSFYNASLTAWSIGQTTAMLDRLTEVAKPRVVIVCLEYFAFIERYARAMEQERSMYFDDNLRIKVQSELYLLRSLYSYPDLMQHSIPDLLGGRPPPGPDGLALLGIPAIRAQAGFRHDGSYLYEQGRIASAPRMVEQNEGFLLAFPGNSGVDSREMRALERLAALARERGTTLVGLQLPILKASVDYLDQAQAADYRGIWDEFQSEAMRHKFEELGILFFDLSRLPFTADGRHFIDAAHTTESGALATLLSLADQPRFLALFPALEKDRLSSDLERATQAGAFAQVYPNRH